MDWSYQIDQEMNRIPGAYQQLGPREEHEYSRFRREWPWTAAALTKAIGLDCPPPRATRFQVGPVFYPTASFLLPHSSARSNPRVCPEGVRVDWHGLVDDHAGGSFGVYGGYDDAPLTDEGILAANKAAIAAGAGAIRSRFILPDALQRSFSQEARGKTNRVCVDVLTLLSASSARWPSRTLMTIEYVDVSGR